MTGDEIEQPTINLSVRSFDDNYSILGLSIDIEGHDEDEIKARSEQVLNDLNMDAVEKYAKRLNERLGDFLG